MRAKTGVGVAALLVAAVTLFGCSGGGSSPGGGAGGSSQGGGGSSAGSGGKPGSGGSNVGSGGQPAASGGAGGAAAGGTGGASTATGGSPASTGGSGAGSGGQIANGGSSGDAAAPVETGGETPSAGGDGTALMVVGPQIIGTDKDIIDALKARNLKVETVLDSMATPAHAEGKSVVVLSYSLDSDNFKADYANVKAPIIVMEHALLAKLGMTSAADHKWAEPVTALSIVNADSPLAAGLPAGDHVVYAKTGEFFWGIPSANAIKVATVKGAPTHWVIFAYPAGAMMVGKEAPGKRLQFFFGAHLVPDMYLNDTGKKLLGAAIDWCIK